MAHKKFSKKNKKNLLEKFIKKRLGLVKFKKKQFHRFLRFR